MRLSALAEAEKGPGVLRETAQLVECYEGHLEGFRRRAKLVDAVEKR